MFWTRISTSIILENKKKIGKKFLDTMMNILFPNCKQYILKVNYDVKDMQPSLTVYTFSYCVIV